MQGQIVKICSNLHYVVKDGVSYPCLPRGKFRKQHILPRVGDYVVFDCHKLVIEKILPRKNEFSRPLVSNIDQAFIITSLKNPDFSLPLLDRFLTLFELHKVKSIICISKKDLLKKEEYQKLKPFLSYYEKIGYQVLSNRDLDKIKAFVKNRTSVFTGQTGAGKSTLLNCLNPDWNLLTGEISKALGRGKHTTRNVELYSFLSGKVLDTPGFSAFTFQNFTKEEIRNSFREFQKYPCPFKDCSHTNEKECCVKQAVKDGKILESRYQNYLHYLKEGK